MSPYSHTSREPEDHQELNEILKRVTKAGEHMMYTYLHRFEALKFLS